MNIDQKTNTILLLSCLAISMLSLSSGCRTGGFAKPDLSAIQFWKSENLMFGSKKSDSPPPPARHFDPAPIDGEKESEIVDLDGKNMQRRFKNDIEEMRAEISAATKALDTPIRKPYSSGLASNLNEFAAETKSNLDSATGNIRSKLDSLTTQAQTDLSPAQNDFQSAMNNTVDSIDGSLAAVNKSIYDANDKFATEAKSKADNAFKSGIGAFGGSLKPLETAVNDSNQFASNASQKAAKTSADANGFLPMDDANSVVKAQPQLELVQAQMADAKRQIAELQKQIAMGSQPNSFAPSTQQAANPNSFGPSIPSQENNSFGTSPIDQMPSTQAAPEARLAQAELPGQGSQFDGNSFSRGMPSNRLRSNQPLRPEAPNQASPSSSSTPNYPATSHGGYAPRSNDFGGNFSPMHQTTPSQNPSAAPNSQVDFQAGSNRSMVVTANNAIPPNASNSASRIQNHVSEVDIPPSVLTGTGSYAPGSVQPLRSDK